MKQWNEKDLFAAGEGFGEFWTLIIGPPTFWQKAPDDFDPMSMESSDHPLADFYGAVFIELWNQDLTEEINECMVYDDFEIMAYEFVIRSLYPYDEVNWKKYLETI